MNFPFRRNAVNKNFAKSDREHSYLYYKSLNELISSPVINLG